MTNHRTFRPAPPHNPLMGPAVCLCLDCCQIMDGKRCHAIGPDGERCGDYRRHRGHHSMIVPTTFLIVDDRLHASHREGLL